MSKSVSNDALWEKLSEIEERIIGYLKEQKAPIIVQNQVDITPEIKNSKEEILNLIKQAVRELDANCNVRFKNIEDGIIYIGKDEGKILEALVCMWTEMKEAIKEQQKQEQKYTQSPFSFKFFKIRKTSVVIALLGLLVFILIMFSMKQQNDYSHLVNEYYRQVIELKEMRMEVESNK